MERREFSHIIGRIKRKRRYRNIDADRFLAILERGKLNPPSLPYGPIFGSIMRKVHSGAPDKKRIFNVRELLRTGTVLPVLGALAIAVLLPLLWHRLAAPTEKGAQCTLAMGSVTFIRPDGTFNARPGGLLRPGDAVVSGESSLTELSAGDEARFRLLENTGLSLAEFGDSGPGKYSLTVEIPRGTVLFNFRKLAGGGRARIVTPTSVAVVRGTSFGVRVDERSNVRFTVLRGRISVSPRLPGGVSAEETAVGEGQSLLITRASHEALVKKVEAILRSGAPGAAAAIAKAAGTLVPPVERAGASSSGLLGDIERFAEGGAGTAPGEDFAELGVDVTPENAAVYLDGERKGKGDITLVVRKGAHTVTVRAPGHREKTVALALDDTRKDIDIRLDSAEAGKFDFGKWASSRDSALVAYIGGDGMIINVGRDGVVEAIAGGSRRWSADLEAAVTAPPVWDRENVYMATAQEKIIALSRNSGHVKWSRSINGHLLSRAGMTYYEGRIYVGTSKGYLYGLTPSGEVKWSRDLGAGVFVAPFVSGRKLFVPTNDGTLYQVGLDDGEVKGSARIGRVLGASKVLRDDRLYLAGLDGDIISYDCAANREVWRYRSGGRIVHGPVLDGDKLFVFTAAGEAHCVNLEGSRRWKAVLGGEIALAPVVRGGEIFIISGSALYVLDGSSGSVKWSYVLQTRPTTPVVLAGNKIMFGTESGGLVVLKRD